MGTGSGVILTLVSPALVADLGAWSAWQPFTAKTVRTAPTTPAVYLSGRRHRSFTSVGRENAVARAPRASNDLRLRSSTAQRAREPRTRACAPRPRVAARSTGTSGSRRAADCSGLERSRGGTSATQGLLVLHYRAERRCCTRARRTRRAARRSLVEPSPLTSPVRDHSAFL